jgi:hypothetical protein
LIDDFEDASEDSYLDEYLVFDASSKADSWIPPRVVVSGEGLPAPDVWFLSGASAFVVDRQVLDDLELSIGSDAELLPVTLAGSTLYLVNVLNEVDCLVRNKSKISVVDGPVQQFEFDPSALPHRCPSLFKIPETAPADVLYLEAPGTNNAGIRDVIGRRGFVGVTFRILWEESVGAIPFNPLDWLANEGP